MASVLKRFTYLFTSLVFLAVISPFYFIFPIFASQQENQPSAEEQSEPAKRAILAVFTEFLCTESFPINKDNIETIIKALEGSSDGEGTLEGARDVLIRHIPKADSRSKLLYQNYLDTLITTLQEQQITFFPDKNTPIAKASPVFNQFCSILLNLLTPIVRTPGKGINYLFGAEIEALQLTLNNIVKIMKRQLKEMDKLGHNFLHKGEIPINDLKTYYGHLLDLYNITSVLYYIGIGPVISPLVSMLPLRVIPAPLEFLKQSIQQFPTLSQTLFDFKQALKVLNKQGMQKLSLSDYSERTAEQWKLNPKQQADNEDIAKIVQYISNIASKEIEKELPVVRIPSKLILGFDIPLPQAGRLPIIGNIMGSVEEIQSGPSSYFVNLPLSCETIAKRLTVIAQRFKTEQLDATTQKLLFDDLYEVLIKQSPDFSFFTSKTFFMRLINDLRIPQTYGYTLEEQKTLASLFESLAELVSQVGNYARKFGDTFMSEKTRISIEDIIQKREEKNQQERIKQQESYQQTIRGPLFTLPYPGLKSLISLKTVDGRETLLPGSRLSVDQEDIKVLFSTIAKTILYYYFWDKLQHARNTTITKYILDNPATVLAHLKLITNPEQEDFLTKKKEEHQEMDDMYAIKLSEPKRTWWEIIRGLKPPQEDIPQRRFDAFFEDNLSLINKSLYKNSAFVPVIAFFLAKLALDVLEESAKPNMLRIQETAIDTVIAIIAQFPAQMPTLNVLKTLCKDWIKQNSELDITTDKLLDRVEAVYKNIQADKGFMNLPLSSEPVLWMIRRILSPEQATLKLLPLSQYLMRATISTSHAYDMAQKGTITAEIHEKLSQAQAHVEALQQARTSVDAYLRRTIKDQGSLDSQLEKLNSPQGQEELITEAKKKYADIYKQYEEAMDESSRAPLAERATTSLIGQFLLRVIVFSLILKYLDELYSRVFKNYVFKHIKTLESLLEEYEKLQHSEDGDAAQKQQDIAKKIENFVRQGNKLVRGGITGDFKISSFLVWLKEHTFIAIKASGLVTTAALVILSFPQVIRLLASAWRNRDTMSRLLRGFISNQNHN